MISGWKTLVFGGLLFVGLAINLAIAQEATTAAAEATTEAPGATTTLEPGATTTLAPGATTTLAPGATTTLAPGASATSASEAKKTPNVDYCDPSLCSHKLRHVACNASTGFHNICSMDAEEIPIPYLMQEFITDEINKIRNKVALGGFNDLGPAARMGTLTWDPELAHLAQYNVRRCFPQHDSCRNTKTHRHVGQLVGYRGLKGNLPIIEDILKDILQMWLQKSHLKLLYDAAQGRLLFRRRGFSQKSPAPLQRTNNRRSPLVIRRYTKYSFLQMVLEDAKQLGCAIVQENHFGWFQTFFTCNFANAPSWGAPIYESSQTPASSCKSGPNKKYPFLCSETETYSRVSSRTGFRYLNSPQEDSLGPTTKKEKSEAVIPPVEIEAKVLPTIQRTLDKVHEQPVRSGNKASGAVVPTVKKQAAVMAKKQRTSHKVNEKLAANGNKVSVPAQASAVVQRPRTKEVKAIKPRSGVKARDGGNKTTEPTGYITIEGNTAAYEKYSLVEAVATKDKQYIRKQFERFQDLMQHAQYYLTYRSIVIITSNHEVTDNSQKVNDANLKDNVVAGEMAHEDSIDISARSRSGIMPRSKGHSSRLRARSSRRHKARTSYSSPNWIAVD